MKAGRETSRIYARPGRPMAVRIANRMVSRLDRTIWGLQPEALLGEAERRNAPCRWKDTSFVRALGILVESIERQARLTPVGRLMTRERILGVMGNRLRAERLFELHPEILAAKLAPAIVVTGLQRSGTTLLHRLLAADPDSRWVASWEALNPAPLVGRDGCPDGGGGARADERERRRRVRIARWSERALQHLSPDFFAVHPVEAEGPEEESILMDSSFSSPVSEAILRVPSYSRWMRGQDATASYRWLAGLLKLLWWQRPASRGWVLKTPHHMQYLGTLVEVMPDVTIVQTHRDPVRTVPSICSMVAHGRGIFSDSVDPVEIGREWLGMQARAVEAAMEAAGGAAKGRIVDVMYEDLVRDPIAQIERIYAHAGIELGSGARAAMQRARGAQRRGRFGRHRYGLEDFGLAEREVREAFARYVDHYGVSREEALE